MPSMDKKPLTEKQVQHLERLNGLPHVRANRFQPGRIGTNCQGWATVPCDTCKAPITRTISNLRRSQQHYCSRACLGGARVGPKSVQAVQLYLEGKTYREIAELIGRSIGTVSTAIYRSQLTRKYGRRGIGKMAVKSKLVKKCELCGYDRTVEMAHIVSQRDGGLWKTDNILVLCPNCHYLYDHKQLTEDELDYLIMVYLLREEETGLAQH